MGYEYRLHITPPLPSLAGACDAVFACTEWCRVATALIDVSGAMGVQRGDSPADPSWPQVADLYVEGPVTEALDIEPADTDSGHTVFVVCHNNNGGLFMGALVAHLERSGHRVTVEDV